MTMVSRLPDDVLRQVLLFSTFQDLDALGYPVNEVLERAGLPLPMNLQWVFYPHRIQNQKYYVPFQYTSVEIGTGFLYVKGRVFTPSTSISSGMWVYYSRICYSPWDYKTTFQANATPDMVPRVLSSSPTDPWVEMTYRGRRKGPRNWTFREGREVDVMDAQGEWWKGTMVACNEDLIRYHFHGWESRWDVWYPKDSLHVAPLDSVVRDWRSFLQEGGWIDVKASGGWYVGRVLQRTPTTVLLTWDNDKNVETMDLSSERLLFYGAHTTRFHGSPFRVSNVVWRDRKGVDIYQYRVRGGKTVLVDHVLSTKEIHELRC